MAYPKARQQVIDTSRYHVLSPVPPFIDICLQSTVIKPNEFLKIIDLATHFENDPRLVEMVRMGGDASAKVPYLMQAGETADSILATLREIAAPYVEKIENLPAPLLATIHLLLSTNAVPSGLDRYGIPALLELDWIQGDFISKLGELMKGRQLALEFHQSNIAALQMLDQDWPRLRRKKSYIWKEKELPEKSQMEYKPVFDKNDRLLYFIESCVVVDAPIVHELRRLTPPVLQRPLPASLPVPITGSADWLIREVGKIGRHVTRAFLEIIKAHLAAEQISLEAHNYDLIHQQAMEALKDYIEKTP